MVDSRREILLKNLDKSHLTWICNHFHFRDETETVGFCDFPQWTISRDWGKVDPQHIFSTRMLGRRFFDSSLSLAIFSSLTKNMIRVFSSLPAVEVFIFFLLAFEWKNVKMFDFLSRWSFFMLIVCIKWDWDASASKDSLSGANCMNFKEIEKLFSLLLLI